MRSFERPRSQFYRKRGPRPHPIGRLMETWFRAQGMAAPGAEGRFSGGLLPPGGSSSIEEIKAKKDVGCSPR